LQGIHINEVEATEAQILYSLPISALNQINNIHLYALKMLLYEKKTLMQKLTQSFFYRFFNHNWM